MNRYLEFHDSTLFSIEELNGVVKILLSPAMIHISEGVSGVDDGAVWLQDVEIVVQEGSFRETDLALPVRISDGCIKLGDTFFENVMEIPFSGQGDVELQLVFPGTSITNVTVKGKGARIHP